MELILKRAKILQKTQFDVKLREAFKIKCKEDIFYWIENFVWIYEPRQKSELIKGSGKIMMSLEGDYAYQKDIISKLLECINEPKDLLIEKSREMGVSWTVIIVFTWGWLFHGWSLLVGSRKEELVDKLNDLDALLPKIRWILKNLPKWMLPKGFSLDKHAVWKNIINPENGATIIGESNNANFGSGGRRTAVLLDEFAKWEYTDRSAWTSLAQSTPCRIALSTPYFKNNKFYELSKSDIMKLRVHYSLNPSKDAKWAEEQKKRMQGQEFAQELDIDYSGTMQAGVYNTELSLLKASGRISPKVEYSNRLPIYIGMDFGMGDLTAMVCCQILGWSEEIRIFDYYENNNKPIQHYIDWLKDADRVWNKDEYGRYIEGWTNITIIPDPFQSTNRELQTGKTLIQVLQGEGFTTEYCHIGRIEGISEVKKWFPRFWFSAKNERINLLLEAISGLHYKFDTEKGEYTSEPVHDKNSHATDALKYVCAYMRDVKDYEKPAHQIVYKPEEINSAGI